MNKMKVFSTYPNQLVSLEDQYMEFFKFKDIEVIRTEVLLVKGLFRMFVFYRESN